MTSFSPMWSSVMLFIHLLVVTALARSPIHRYSADSDESTEYSEEESVKTRSLTWVWGEGLDVDAIMPELDIGTGIEEVAGFIRLTGTGTVLEIELVHRPTWWGREDRFCSLLLPATVRAFFDYTRFNVRQSVRPLGPHSAADRVGSCLRLCQRPPTLERSSHPCHRSH